MVNDENTMMNETQYFISLKSDEIKKLDTITIVICIDNLAFRHNQLKTLIDEINQICQSSQNKLTKVNFVDTSYLNRFYDDTYASLEISQWKKENLKYIESLTIDYEIIDWSSYLKHPLYKEYYNQISDDYSTNRAGFKNVAEKFAHIFAHKNGFQAATNYFLEESAVFRLNQGVILYPGRLKDPFDWVIKNYPDTKVTMLSYSIKPKTMKHIKQIQQSASKQVKNCASTAYQPTFFALTVASFADNAVGNNLEKQIKFMSKFIDLCHEFSDTVSISDEEKNYTDGDKKVLHLRQ